MQPYRSDLEALEARHAALEAEVADRVRQRDDAARMLAEARARQRDAEIAADRAAGGPARRKSFVISVGIGALAFAGMIAAFAHIARPSQDAKMARVMAQFERFANEACQCNDKACVADVSERMSKWGSEVSKDLPPNSKPDEKTMKRAAELGQRMSDCMSKAIETPHAYETQQGGMNGNGNSNDTVIEHVERE